MSETRNFDKTINDFIMTADEITQLLYERNIVFIFNEDIPCSKHDETIKFLKKGLASEEDDYMFDIINCPFIDRNDIWTAPAYFLNMMFRILKDIENSNLNNATFVFRGGFLSIFANMLESEQVLTRLSENISMPLESKIGEIKLSLESAWLKYNHPADDWSCMKEYMTDTFMWNGFISAIFQCGHIHVISYYPDNLEKIKYEAPHICMEGEDDVATIMLSNRKLALLLDSITGDRSKAKVSPQYPEASLNNYFRTERRLFLNSTVIKNIVDPPTKNN